MLKSVYNLEFPVHADAISVSGYTFQRISRYGDALLKLQHRVARQSEFRVEVTVGGHAHTADVDIPDPEPPANLSWAEPAPTLLQDLLLLLSMFTQRDVFVDDGDPARLPLSIDPRMYHGGGVLICSLYQSYPAPDFGAGGDVPEHRLQLGLEDISELLAKPSWRSQYGDGFFLLLLRQAMRSQTLESAFVQSWTIWEHLFSVMNQPWLGDGEIRKLESREKLAFLIVNVLGVHCIDADARIAIGNLVKTRNRLIHFGRFPPGTDEHARAFFFIRLTEYLAARILGLTPSNVFNTIEELEHFCDVKGITMS